MTVAPLLPMILTQTFAPGSWGTGPPFSGWYGFSESWTPVYLNEQNTPPLKNKTNQTNDNNKNKPARLAADRQGLPLPLLLNIRSLI